MKRLACVLLLTACSCSHAPTVDAASTLALLKHEYVVDLHDQAIYCNLHTSCDSVRTAGYNASASLTVAEGDPSASALAKARADLSAFTEALRQ